MKLGSVIFFTIHICCASWYAWNKFGATTGTLVCMGGMFVLFCLIEICSAIREAKASTEELHAGQDRGEQAPAVRKLYVTSPAYTTKK